jgi:mannose-6-phosphate isomerase-like protein (cupin superfamily)
MIKANFIIDNPLTNSKTKVIESDQETKGMGWLLEVICQPNAKPDIKEHIHLSWTETFEIISGEAFYKLNGTERRASTGESFTVTPGQKHIHPWCAGNVPMVYTQKNEFGKHSPDAVQEVLGVFATVAGLAREGKVNKDGLPKNSLHLAATLRTLAKHGGYDTSIPIGATNFASATLGKLAELLGYKGVYSRYLEK